MERQRVAKSIDERICLRKDFELFFRCNFRFLADFIIDKIVQNNDHSNHNNRKYPCIKNNMAILY